MTSKRGPAKGEEEDTGTTLYALYFDGKKREVR